MSPVANLAHMNKPFFALASLLVLNLNEESKIKYFHDFAPVNLSYLKLRRFPPFFKVFAAIASPSFMAAIPAVC